MHPVNHHARTPAAVQKDKTKSWSKNSFQQRLEPGIQRPVLPIREVLEYPFFFFFVFVFFFFFRAFPFIRVRARSRGALLQSAGGDGVDSAGQDEGENALRPLR